MVKKLAKTGVQNKNKNKKNQKKQKDRGLEILIRTNFDVDTRFYFSY